MLWKQCLEIKESACGLVVHPDRAVRLGCPAEAAMMERLSAG